MQQVCQILLHIFRHGNLRLVKVHLTTGSLPQIRAIDPLFCKNLYVSVAFAAKS